MLKKRILASSMASVMALTSFSAVAFAADEEKYGNKTVADLKEYVESDAVQKFVGSKDYNATRTANFNDAYRYAQNVVKANSSSEATVAYRMLSAVVDDMRYWTVDELRELIAEVKGVLGDNNKLEGGDGADLRYSDSSYNNCKSRLRSAETIAEKNATDIRKVDKAYDDLNQAYNALEKYDEVYKADFKSVYDSLNDLMVNNKQKYDAWTRIKIANSGVNGYDGFTVAYGTFYYHMNTIFNRITATYKPFSDKRIDKTTNTNIIAAYKAAKEALAVMDAVINKCEPDAESIAFKGDVQDLIGKGGAYHKRLAYDFGSVAVAALVGQATTAANATGTPANLQIKNGDGWENYNGSTHTAANSGTTTGFSEGWELNYNGPKLADANFTIKFKTAAYVVYNEDGTIARFAANEAAASVNPSIREYGQAISDGNEFNLAELVNLSASLKAVTAVTDRADAVDPNGVVDSDVNENCPHNAHNTTLGACHNDGSIYGGVVAIADDSKGYTFKSNAPATTTVALGNILAIAQNYLEDITSVSASGTAANVSGDLVAKVTFSAGTATATSDATLTCVADGTTAKLSTDTTVGNAVTLTDYGITGNTLSVGDLGKTISYDGEASTKTCTGSLIGSSANFTFDDTAATEATAKTLTVVLINGTPTLSADGTTAATLDNFGLKATSNELSKGDVGKTLSFTAAVAAPSAESTDMSTKSGLVLNNGTTLKKMLLDANIDTNGSWLQQLPGNANLYKEDASGKRSDILWEEWTDIYNYLNYALKDKYTDPAAATDAKTRSDVISLINSTKALENVTYNVPMFTEWYKNAMAARQDAEKWVDATNLSSYVDNDAVNGKAVVKDAQFFKGVAVDGRTPVNMTTSGAIASEVYADLEYYYNKLNDKNNQYNLSYQTIADTIAIASSKYDENGKESLKDAIDACAYALSIVKKDSASMQEAFSNSRVFNGNNRLDSWAAPGTSQHSLQVAYNNLKKAMEDQLRGDVDNNGKVNISDVTALLTHVIKKDYGEKGSELFERCDINDDNHVNVQDATALLKIIIDAKNG